MREKAAVGEAWSSPRICVCTAAQPRWRGHIPENNKLSWFINTSSLGKQQVITVHKQFLHHKKQVVFLKAAALPPPSYFSSQSSLNRGAINCTHHEFNILYGLWNRTSSPSSQFPLTRAYREAEEQQAVHRLHCSPQAKAEALQGSQAQG